MPSGNSPALHAQEVTCGWCRGSGMVHGWFRILRECRECCGHGRHIRVRRDGGPPLPGSPITPDYLEPPTRFPSTRTPKVER